MPDEPILDPGTQDPGTEENQPFLVVDDRTRYATQEEAVEGYRNAGQRIAELTPWQEVASQYGVRSPQDVAALLDELAELRATKLGRSNTSDDANRSTSTSGAEGSQPAVAKTPEEIAAVKWLETHGAAAGYVTKKELEGLMTKLDELSQRSETLSQSNESVEAERAEQRIEAGRAVLESELKGLGVISADGKAAKPILGFVENALTTWVNSNQAYVNAWYGSKSDREQLIKTGLQEIMPVLNILKNQPVAANTAARANAQNRTRTATATASPAAANRQSPGRTNPQNEPQPKKNTLDTGEDLTPDTHNRAWEALRRQLGDQA